DLLKSWLTTVDMPQENYYVIARSAFGKLYVWGENSGWCLTISSYSTRYFRRTSKFTGEKLGFGVKAFFHSLILNTMTWRDFSSLPWIISAHLKAMKFTASSQL
ncbi:hypothetical protein PSYPI_40209, partial [Pseudomonas syringae pv. pisi str. 1704B]